MTALSLSFQNTTFSVIERNGEPWLKANEIAQALGYTNEDAVSRIYRRNADEFTDQMTETVKLTVSGENNNLRTTLRIFSLRGAHLIAMFARTDVAKAFRVWVLDVLDRNQQQPPLPTDLPTALRLYADQLEQNAKLHQELADSRPKVEFHDQVVLTEKTYSFSEVFGLLQHFTGQNFNGASFLQFLRDNGIACQPNPHTGIGKRKFSPRQNYINSWFVAQLTPAGETEWRLRPIGLSSLVILINNSPAMLEAESSGETKQLTH